MKRRESSIPADAAAGMPSIGDVRARFDSSMLPDGVTQQITVSSEFLPIPSPDDLPGLRQAAEHHARRAAVRDDARAAHEYAQSKLYTADADALEQRMKEAKELAADGPVSQGTFCYHKMTADSIQPAPWRLLQFMWGKTEADLDAAYRVAKDDKGDKIITESAVNSMIRKANAALETVNYPKRLSKPKNVRKIVWG